jgi:hypothetical protein
MEEHTVAERLRSAEVTLATIRGQAEQVLAVQAAAGAGVHSPGYINAMRSVLAILNSRWTLKDMPANFGERP